MNAGDIMTNRSVWSCSEATSCREAAEMMAMRNVGCLPVTSADGKVVGIVTDRDLACRLVAPGRTADSPVRDVMSGPVFCCYPETSLQEMEAMMREYRVRRLPVVDEERRLVGIVSLSDVACRARGFWKEHRVVETLEAVSSG